MDWESFNIMLEEINEAAGEDTGLTAYDLFDEEEIATWDEEY